MIRDNTVNFTFNKCLAIATPLHWVVFQKKSKEGHGEGRGMGVTEIFPTYSSHFIY